MSLPLHKTSQTLDDKIPEEETDWGPATRGRSGDSGLYVYCCPHLRQSMWTLLKKSQDRISVGSKRRKSQSKTCHFLCQPVRHLAPLGTHIYSNRGQNEGPNSVLIYRWNHLEVIFSPAHSLDLAEWLERLTANSFVLQHPTTQWNLWLYMKQCCL